MNEREVRAQEEILRRELQRLGLGWILDQVDEALANEASEAAEPPSAARRLEVLVDAVAFAVEVSEAAEGAVLPLLTEEPPAADPEADGAIGDRLEVDVVRFVDPTEREAVREVGRERPARSRAAPAVRAAADRLKAEVGR